MKYSILGVVMAALMSANASGEVYFKNGSQLLQECKSESSTELGICSGYVLGVADASQTWSEWAEFDTATCKPKEGTAGQMSKVVVKYLEEYPEKLHLTASGAVIMALSKAFPCEE